MLYLTLAHFAIAVVIIAATSVLAALHDIDAQAVTALFGTAVGLVGGSGAGFVGTLRTANGKTNGSPA